MGKRLKSISAQRYPQSLEDALSVVSGGSGVKFDESIEASIHLGIDTRMSDQQVRGAVVLPAGSGRHVRIGVIAQSAQDRQSAQEAGADVVGFEDVSADIGAGKIAFDVLLATPDSMRYLASVAKVLGPRGLMPNPKNGTVVKNVAEGVERVRLGQISYRADKYGIVHAAIGKVSFTVDQLKENAESLIHALKKSKPSSSKGIYLRRMFLSPTMGRSVCVDISSYR